MRWRLVGDNVGDDAAQLQLGVNISRVANQPDGFGHALVLRFFHHGHGFFQVIGDRVHIADLQTALGALAVDLHDQANTFVHGDSERLGAAHAAQAGGEHKLALQRGPAALMGKRA